MTINVWPRRADGGFTLMEVLVAMVILAVGLMGLEALGLRAVRSLGLADRNSRSTSVASYYLEDALQQVRSGTVPPQLCDTLPGGDDIVSRVVDTSDGDLIRVAVTVTPDSRGGLSSPTTITAHVFRPNPLTTLPAGNACP